MIIFLFVTINRKLFKVFLGQFCLQIVEDFKLELAGGMLHPAERPNKSLKFSIFVSHERGI